MRSFTLGSMLALALSATACDPVSPTFVDAAEVVPIDAPTDVAIGPATITVNRERNETGAGTPIAGTRVYFIRPDGTYQVVTTGADGRASADVVPGSAILASHPRNRAGLQTTYLTAFVGIGPGFDVIAGSKPRATTTSAGRVTFTWTALPGATVYRVSANCGFSFGSSTTTVAFDVYTPCAQAAAATVVVTAYNAADAVIGYSVEPSVNLTAALGTTRAMPAFTTTPATASMTYSMIPNTIGTIDTELLLLKDEATFGDLVRYRTPVTGTSLTLSAPVVPVGATTFEKSTFRATGESNLLPVHHFRRQPTQQLTQTLDLAPNLLPFVTQPSFNPGTRTAAWTPTGGGPSRNGDVVVLRGYWSVNSLGTVVDFTVVGPSISGLSSVTIPTLPTELADLIPAASDSGDANEIWMIDVVGKEGYQAVAGTVVPESERFYYDSSAFPNESELWFSGFLPQ